jgi:hypothetical protein
MNSRIQLNRCIVIRVMRHLDGSHTGPGTVLKEEACSVPFRLPRAYNALCNKLYMDFYRKHTELYNHMRNNKEIHFNS